MELYDLAVEAGFKPIAGVAALAEHSMVRSVAAGRPDEADKAVLKEFGIQIKARAEQAADVLRPEKLPGNRPYKILTPEPCSIQLTGTCIECGACVMDCPVGAIPAERPYETDGTLCIGCMSCVDICPAQARGLNPQKAAFITEFLGKTAAGRKENQLFL